MDLEKLKKVGLEVREMNSLISEQAEKSKNIPHRGSEERYC